MKRDELEIGRNYYIDGTDTVVQLRGFDMNDIPIVESIESTTPGDMVHPLQLCHERRLSPAEVGFVSQVEKLDNALLYLYSVTERLVGINRVSYTEAERDEIISRVVIARSRVTKILEKMEL